MVMDGTRGRGGVGPSCHLRNLGESGDIIGRWRSALPGYSGKPFTSCLFREKKGAALAKN